MITDLIISMVIVLLKAFFGLFPIVTELPWGLDAYVSQAISTFRGFADIFPPLESIFVAFTIYLSFRLMLMLFAIIPVFGKMLSPHKNA